MMAFTARLTGRVQRDFDRMLAWLGDRSIGAARRLEAACEAAVTRIAESPFQYGFAPENEFAPIGIRQIVFKTRRGKPHRALFVVEGDNVWVIHVRGPGQNILTDIVPPPSGSDE